MINLNTSYSCSCEANKYNIINTNMKYYPNTVEFRSVTITVIFFPI